MKIFETEIEGLKIELTQREDGKYKVMYHYNIERDLQYDQAAEELGYSIMHALQISGKLKD